MLLQHLGIPRPAQPSVVQPSQGALQQIGEDVSYTMQPRQHRLFPMPREQIDLQHLQKPNNPL